MRVLVTGGSGLVGEGIRSVMDEFREYEFVFLSSSMCDLSNLSQTLHTFEVYSPDVIVHLAAQVGGLFLNIADRVGMFEKNIRINTNVLEAAHRCHIRRVIGCLSTCIFPDGLSSTLTEEMLHDGPPHESNEPYAYAKRMLEIHARAYREQYGYDYTCVIPTNVYGPHDNFHLERGHVVPSLIHKCFLAKTMGHEFVVAGTGTPLRQFIYSHDLARLLLQLIPRPDVPLIILSVDPSEEISIGEVATMIADAFAFPHDRLRFDTTLPDGQHKKTADTTRMRSIFPEYKFTDIRRGIQTTVEWFIKHYGTCRR